MTTKERFLEQIDLDEYHEAIEVYRGLVAGEYAILILGGHKYIKVEDSTFPSTATSPTTSETKS